MLVKVLSKVIVEPSSRTPPHLKTFKLSLLDQLSPLIYTSLVFFYVPALNKNDESEKKNSASALKISLSETLSHFPLLAGRIIDKSIDCNDEGALFLEASVDCSISEFLKEPNSEILSELLPCNPLCTEAVEEYPHIVAQLNTFKCGGIAICVCFLHKLMDATTLSCFLRCWASINGDSSPIVVSSDYEQVSSIFPQTQLLPFHPRNRKFSSQDSERKNCFQRFVFDGKAISDLKTKAKSINVPNPTSVEVVTSFIWKYAMEAASVRVSSLMHAVNLRKRMEPPLPEFSVGNIFWVAISQNEANETTVELKELVSHLRGAFAEIDGNYVQKFTGEKGTRAVLKFIKEAKELFSKIPKLYVFSSWRNMHLNEVDFGWGKPRWVSMAWASDIIRKNVVILLDSMSGDGIEAWMLLDEEEM